MENRPANVDSALLDRPGTRALARPSGVCRRADARATPGDPRNDYRILAELPSLAEVATRPLTRSVARKIGDPRSAPVWLLAA